MVTLPFPPRKRRLYDKSLLLPQLNVPSIKPDEIDYREEQIAAAQEPRRELPSFNEVLSRMSDQQVRDVFGLAEGQDISGYRKIPEAQVELPAEKVEALREATANGSFRPDNDDKIDAVGKALEFIAKDSPLAPVFKALEIYDQYVNTPFTAVVVDAITRFLPGDQQVETLTDKYVAEGKNFLEARIQAFQDADLPPLVKEALKFVIDPTIVGGVVTANLKALKLIQATPLAFKAATRTLLSQAEVKASLQAFNVGGKQVSLPEGVQKYISNIPLAKDVAQGSPELSFYAYKAQREVGRGLSGLAVNTFELSDDIWKTFKFRDGKLTALPDNPSVWDAVVNRNVIEMSAVQRRYLQGIDSFREDFTKMARREGVLKVTQYEDPITEAVTTVERLKGVEIEDAFAELLTLVPKRVNVGGQTVTQLLRPNGQTSFLENTSLFQRLFRTMQGGDKLDTPLPAMRAFSQEVYDMIALKRLEEDVAPLVRLGPKGLNPDVFVSHPHFGSSVIETPDIQTAKRIESMLKESGLGLLEPIKSASDAVRQLRATADFSAPLIQGLVPLFSRPKEWAEATLWAVRALADPLARNKFIKANPHLAAEWVQHGGSFGGSEWTTSLFQGGWLAKIVDKPVIKQTAGLLLKRAGASFETFLDVGSLLVHRSLRTVARNDKEIGDVVDTVSKMFGRMSPGKLGLSRTQQEVESSFFFFSSIYTRSVTSLLLDVARKGTRGTLARQAMADFAYGATAGYVGMALALNQEPRLDPSKGDFMTVTLDGQDVGFGGKHRSLLRLIQQSLSSAAENPVDFFTLSAFDDTPLVDHPWIRWLRSQAPPGGSLPIEILTGQDAIGRTIPNPAEDFVDWTKFFGGRFLPFALEDVLEEGQFNPTGFALSEAGLNARDQTAQRTLRLARDKHAATYVKANKLQQGTTWGDLDESQRLDIEIENADLVQLEEEADKSRREFANSKEKFRALDAIESADAEFFDSVNFVGDNLDTLGGRGFRDSLSKLSLKKRAKKEAIREEHGALFDTMEKLDAERIATARTQGRLFSTALKDFMEEVAGAEVNGLPSPQLSKFNEEKLRKEYGDKLIDQVESYLSQTQDVKGLHPNVLAYYKARTALQEFFELPGKTLSPEDASFYETIKGLSPADQAAVLKNSVVSARFKLLEQRVELAEDRLLRDKPTLDYYLVRFYDRAPRRPETIRKLRGGV